MRTSWYKKGASPSSYSDVASACKLGSAVRRKIVDFEWCFSREELLRLRQAVHFWGSHLQGQFRAFEALMLGALNEALGERSSVYKLWPPGGPNNQQFRVDASTDGDRFRLQGQGTFAVIFTYGLYGCKALSPPNYWFRAVGVRLGPELARKLQAAVEQLGWDMAEMARPELQPAVNKIFGLPSNYVDDGTDIQMMTCSSTQHLEFYGPFHWKRSTSLPCLFEAPEGKQGGIYLWTVQVGPEERVHYIGQSRRSFRQRLKEHLDCYLTGEYKIVEPTLLAQGRLTSAWDGAAAFDDAGRRLEEWLDSWEIVLPELKLLLETFKFHLAPFDGDKRLQERVEGAIGAHFLCHEDEAIREFLDPGSRFLPRRAHEDPIRFTFETDSAIAGFPKELPV